MCMAEGAEGKPSKKDIAKDLVGSDFTLNVEPSKISEYPQIPNPNVRKFIDAADLELEEMTNKGIYEAEQFANGQPEKLFFSIMPETTFAKELMNEDDYSFKTEAINEVISRNAEKPEDISINEIDKILKNEVKDVLKKKKTLEKNSISTHESELIRIELSRLNYMRLIITMMLAGEKIENEDAPAVFELNAYVGDILGIFNYASMYKNKINPNQKIDEEKLNDALAVFNNLAQKIYDYPINDSEESMKDENN